MNVTAPQSLFDEVNASLAKLAEKDPSPADNPDYLGQCAIHLPDACPSNTLNWMLEGMFFAYVEKHDPTSRLKSLCAAREAAGYKNGDVYNYCDGDLNVWAWHWQPDELCLECKSGIASVLQKKRGHDTPPEVCPECKGTGVESRFKKDVWLVHHENHGNGYIYLAKESAHSFKLEIRVLPYNTEKAAIKELHEALLTHINSGAMEKWGQTPNDKLCPVLANEYGPNFLLKLSIDKPHDYLDGVSHDVKVGEQVHRALQSIETILQHFPCVQEDHEKQAEAAVESVSTSSSPS
jgi:hypothetical protein